MASKGAVCGLMLLFVTSALAEGSGPLEVVRATAEQTMEELKKHRKELEDNPRAIYGLVEQYVLPRFDFELISRYVLGAHWRKATPAQQGEFVVQFRNLMVRTYAHALLHYSDQEIEYKPVRDEAGGKRVLVGTVVHQRGAPDIPIDYRLYQRDDGEWRVFDVLIDGVSLVSNYRTSFSGHIRRVGVDGLIGWLQERNAESST